MYKLLLADADGTLFDFHKGERVAVGETFTAFGVPVNEETQALYHRINDEQWKMLERGETTQQRLRVERFRLFLQAIQSEADPEAMCAAFIKALSRQRFPLDGAEEFVRTVSAHMPIYLVTNGIAEVQRGRFSDCALTPYLSGMVVSEEIGHPKPHPAMVLEAMRQAGISDKREVILMGDSLTADIAAATNAGVDSLLFTNGAPPPEGNAATYVATDYQQARAIVLRP